ncbi:MAG TPA: adenylate/guanylate cyclase domain-containing protein [Candidatus Binataceae bacterium]|nr:adenylate/guanylate cyclase domain-containing protein [Candidatus Binataceae bacterium]
MKCAACGQDNREGRKFCAECGAPLASKCPQCGASNEPSEKFCGECGSALAAPATAKKSIEAPIRVAEAPAPENLEGERKTVTALFADIKGSTEMMEDLDPENARAIIDPALKLMMDAVHRYDGYVVQSTGDGIFALFGAPIAHEDHPQRTLYAALRMQEELRRYSAEVVADGGTPIQGRIGINTGEVVVRSIHTGAGHVEYTPIGHMTNLASRMQTAAPVGSIAVTEGTRKLCEGYFILNPLGPTRVKGVTEPVNVYEAIGLGPLRTRLQRSAGRGLTKFVGREREMDAMKAAAERAKAGRGQIVAAMAEAGVGKSRLFFEFKAVSQSGWMVLEAFSVSHGKASAFLPVIDLLWGYFEISSEDDERKRREKINGKIVTLDRSLEDALPYLYGLLGITDENSQIAEVEAQTRKRRALDAIKRILLRESLNQPLIVIFEDLHWIDEETQAFLNLLAESIGTARILLLVNYRPEYRHEWGHKTYYTQLRLDPLGKESADEMLSALLGDGAELGALKRLIIEKTEGNPFFMEETVLVLLDEGALVRNGTVKLTRPLNQLKIPPTVQAILAARIDRLSADQKDLLQTLAVIGTEFKLGLVRKVSAHTGAELETMLSELQLGEFIYEQPAVGDVEYIFKHALTHDVAYNSLLNERRRVLHERIGAALESIYADGLDDHVPELAHHYMRSGNSVKGVEYCLRGVQQCSALGSFPEALAQFETGLELLRKLPDDDHRAELELDLRNAAMRALFTIKGFASPEHEQSSARTAELRQRLTPNFEKTWFALVGTYFVSLGRGDVRKMCEISADLIARAEEHGSTEYLAEATNLLAIARMFSGDFGLADEGFEGAWALESIPRPAMDPARQGDKFAALDRLGGKALNRVFSARSLWPLGYPDRALERVDIATTIARETGSKAIMEVVHDCAIYIYDLRCELEHMRERADAMLTLSTELGNVSRRARSEIFLGWAQVLAGDLDGGIAGMQHHLAELRIIDTEFMKYFPYHMAAALGQLRRFDEALRTIDEAFAFFERTGQRLYEAEVHRVKGELLLAQDASNAARAEQSFCTAIEISRRQKAKSWELRATTSLARLLRDTNRIDEARMMLADIYNWFTEGFDTADLKDAKALLEQLNG